MSTFSERSEQIAAHLVAHATGADVVPHDTDGRQGAVDFQLEWPDGRVGALEVTLVTELDSIQWQGMALTDGWSWKADTSWEFRPVNVSFHYKNTKRAALRTVELCDHWEVEHPSSLPAEFIDAAPSAFARVVKTWLEQPHVAPHLEKAKRATQFSERHLFVVVMSEALPVRFFEDNFEEPAKTPQGFEGVDVLWVWSDFWQRYLAFKDDTWSWNQFPPKPDTSTT